MYPSACMSEPAAPEVTAGGSSCITCCMMWSSCKRAVPATACTGGVGRLPGVQTGEGPVAGSVGAVPGFAGVAGAVPGCSEGCDPWGDEVVCRGVVIMLSCMMWPPCNAGWSVPAASRAAGPGVVGVWGMRTVEDGGVEGTVCAGLEAFVSSNARRSFALSAAIFFVWLPSRGSPICLW